MKIVCGIEICGNDANIVLIEGNKIEYSIIKSEFKKIRLDDDGDQSQIKSFHEAIENFVRQSKVDKLCIRRPSTSRKFTASPTAFKIEAILQLGSVPVVLFHSASIASILKKTAIQSEKYESIHKYQHAALGVAFCGLEC